jgi:transcriptional regulator with PAS, ATPase and Fis domain
VSKTEGEALSETGQNSFDLTNLVVRSDSLKRVMKLAEQVARHPAAVLVTGETGTGKEMIARAIHGYSLRCNGPWVDVNCAAIPEHLVESELFGYEKGAFSGADAMKPGFFEMADKGTLFLDEIGDLDAKVQVKLLRVLDGIPYYRLGGSKKVMADVRIVAATNHDLEGLVQSGRFRRDLYHRLAQFTLEVPPLRERPEDLVGIAEALLHHHHPGSRFTEDAIRSLVAHAWPGNVRELRNAVFRAVLQAQEPQVQITAADLQLPTASLQEEDETAGLEGDLNQVEKQMIFQALERFAGNQSKAAASLGISRRTLIRRLKMYREAGAEGPPDTLRLEQQIYYRAQIKAPARLKCGEEKIEATILNLSLGGAAISTEKPLQFGTRALISFRVPGTDLEAELNGKVVWSNAGQHGIKFAEVPAGISNHLQRWLLSQMKKDGWGSALTH